jgi:S-adenosylmethionine hydrolase
MTAPIITLLSDFGLKDHYVAEMKAVISNICPRASIIDISHLVEKFNIRMGAFVLASASRYFPKGTIHIAVVDPGVGTKRRALIVQTEHAFYIGPDNGLLILAAQRQGIQHVYSITNPKLMLPKASLTFHGRDVFAPSAANLANKVSPSDFGPEISDYEAPKFTKPTFRADEFIGEVLHVDDFGNIVTNITGEDLEKIEAKPTVVLSVKLRNELLKMRFCNTYGDVIEKTVLALIGSHSYLEIAVNQGNASKKLEAKVGDAVAVSLQG